MAETIYMVHGMCCAAWAWDNYRSFFGERGYHCVAPTLRYHDIDPRGHAPAQLGTTSLLDYVQDLEAEIDQLRAAPILMGHSLGGLLAQLLSSRAPSKALILLGPSPPAGILAFRLPHVRGFGSVLGRWGWWNQPIRPTFREAAYSMLNGLSGSDQRRTYAQFVHESGQAAFEAGLWFLDRKQAAHVDQSQVICPVLILAGAQDRIAPASVMRRIAHKYEPHATYTRFPNHAHWLIAEPGWQEVAAYICTWLDRVAGQS
jgi:pimeloyl-ACP methyl ester carboxylesterase